ncbi:hypothetical protein EJ110_NYTH49845 [Nymphaea thermarum]|nr:hypothetical protein EJ110_NYTH49845 [Nymphaea thermarum]
MVFSTIYVVVRGAEAVKPLIILVDMHNHPRANSLGEGWRFYNTGGYQKNVLLAFSEEMQSLSSPSLALISTHLVYKSMVSWPKKPTLFLLMHSLRLATGALLFSDRTHPPRRHWKDDSAEFLCWILCCISAFLAFLAYYYSKLGKRKMKERL